MNYQVRITDSGRGGTIFYTENAEELSFGWEFAIDGALIFVPSPQDFNKFCEVGDLPLSQDRRDEIFKRVCEEVIRQKAAGAEYTLGDDYISISFRS